MKLSYDKMRELGIAAFTAAGIADDIAKCVTDALLLAELDGMPSHSFSRIPFYVDQAKTGKVTVKKGLKKGTYKVKVNVKAAGSPNYNAVTRAVTFTIKVK